MIHPLTHLDNIDRFDKHTLSALKPYFDIDHLSDQKELWFKNLFVLAQHSLGIAHCLFHHQGARLGVMIGFQGKSFPDFYTNNFDDQIAALSNRKVSDSVSINNNVVTGDKHWISNLRQADYGVFSVKDGDKEAMVLYDFGDKQHRFHFYNPPIGMEIADAGSIVNNCYTVPEGYLLGHRVLTEANGKFSNLSSFTDYGFITNYMGLIVALFKDLEQYNQDNCMKIDTELAQLKLDIAGLKMMWEINLPSVNETTFTDYFWHKRNTQYVKSKQVLLSLINLVLKAGNPRWFNINSTGAGQRARDAVVFVAHQKNICKNLQDRNFVDIERTI